MTKINEKTGRIDYLDGDYSWKRWFKEMTSGDKYLYYFSFCLIIVIIELFLLPGISSIIAENYFESGLLAGIGCSFAFTIPVWATSFLGYFGLYKSWEEMKGN